MAVRLDVRNLSWGTDEQALKRAFSEFGRLMDAVVAKDWETGRSRGFGHVIFANAADAETALMALNGQRLDGRAIDVRHADGGVPAVRTQRSATAESFRSADFDGGGRRTVRAKNYYRGEDYIDDGRLTKHKQSRGVYRSADFDGSGVPTDVLPTAAELASPTPPDAPTPRAPNEAELDALAKKNRDEAQGSDGPTRRRTGDGDDRNPFG